MAVSIPPGSVALVIDNEETVRSFAMSALSRAGMKVLVADNGKTGVEMFREHSGIVSVALLDLLTPVKGGEDVLALLRETNPDVPIILSSGFDEAEAARRFSEPKPARFLQKPYTMERLVEAVAAVLNRPKV
jgi:DNA-binding NtrC family response regulator